MQDLESGTGGMKSSLGPTGGAGGGLTRVAGGMAANNSSSNANPNAPNDRIAKLGKEEQLQFVGGNSVAMMLAAPVVSGPVVTDENGNVVATLYRPMDGRIAWKVAFGSFLSHVSVLGMLYTFGIFVLPIADEFGAGRGEVSLISTVGLGMFYLTGMVSVCVCVTWEGRGVQRKGGLT